MPRLNRDAYYAAIMAKYSDNTTISDIARTEGIKVSTLGSAVRIYKLRTLPAKRQPVDRIMRRLTLGKTDIQVAAGIVSTFAIASWRNGTKGPLLRVFQAVCEANGLTLDVRPRSLVGDLMDRINELRTMDLTGAEVCAELSDFVMDEIEGLASDQPPHEGEAI